MTQLPEATNKPCNECPWRRKALAGHLGPLTAEEWTMVAHGDAAIACHKTIRVSDGETEGDWSHPLMRQCAGAAIFRANVFKSPRNPEVAVADEQDYESVFKSSAEFIAHHDGPNDIRQFVAKRRARR